MPIQTIRGNAPVGHVYEWALAPQADSAVSFSLRCRSCFHTFDRVAFDWIGSDGPGLGSVFRELCHRGARVERALVDEPCPHVQDAA